ncbi:hypothetical protein JCM8547_006731 [Rhodosporidiobolus lusitaniae]
MATTSTVELNAPHPPHANSIRGFATVEEELKRELVKLRHHWDQHEPKMFVRAKDVSDEELTSWELEKDLEQVRSASTAYGAVIFGKLRIPAIVDGYIHVRIHDTPGEAQENVRFHSIYTGEIRNDEGKVVDWQAIQTKETPLEFFNE